MCRVYICLAFVMCFGLCMGVLGSFLKEIKVSFRKLIGSANLGMRIIYSHVMMKMFDVHLVLVKQNNDS